MAGTLLATSLLSTLLAALLGVAGASHAALPPTEWTTGGTHADSGAPMKFPFGWTAAVGGGAAPGPASAGGGISFASGAQPAASFDVPTGATHIHLVATWTCATPTCEAQIGLFPPGVDTSAGPATVSEKMAAAKEVGSGSVTLNVPNPAAGSWAARASPASPSLNLDGTFEVTLA
ncbi:MAG: hypothetical protein ACYDBQ_08300 [Thermoplasmatota archaeon]